MKALALSLGAALALAGCNMASDEDQMENAIRENLASRGEVKQIEITRQEDGTFAGFAVVVQDGREGRLACTGRRDGTTLNYECLPDIDEATLQQMETQIRDRLAQQAEVVEVDLSRVDHSRMNGFARVRDGGGNEVRMGCTATRESRETSNFQWTCTPEGEDTSADTAQQAPAANLLQPPAGSEPGGKPGAEEAMAEGDPGKD